MVIEISNKNAWEYTSFTMMINLDYLIQNTGKRFKDKYTGEYYTECKVKDARGLLNLIREYGTPEQLIEVDRYMLEHKDDNKKVYELWNR